MSRSLEHIEGYLIILRTRARRRKVRDGRPNLGTLPGEFRSPSEASPPGGQNWRGRGGGRVLTSWGARRRRGGGRPPERAQSGDPNSAPSTPRARLEVHQRPPHAAQRPTDP